MEPLLFWALETLFFNDFSQTPPSSSSLQTAFRSQISGAATQAQSVPFVPAAQSAPPIDQSIEQAALSTGLSPALLKAVATVESSLNPNAVSSAGAIGVMQLMPATAQSLHVDPYSTPQNLLGGAEYLKSLLDAFHGDLPLALAAYNAGPGAVQHFGGVPPYQQTQNYVQKVLSTYQALSTPSSPGPLTM